MRGGGAGGAGGGEAGAAGGLAWVLYCGTSDDTAAGGGAAGEKEGEAGAEEGGEEGGQASNGQAGEELRLARAYTQLLTALNPSMSLEEAQKLSAQEQRQQVENKLLLKPGFLLVFDNVLPEHVDAVARHLPRRAGLTGQVLVTTQDSVALPKLPRLALCGLQLAEAKRLLGRLCAGQSLQGEKALNTDEEEEGEEPGGEKTREGDNKASKEEEEEKALEAICEFVGCHPFALAQAGAYIHQTRMFGCLSLPEYLQRLRQARRPTPSHHLLQPRTLPFSIALALARAQFNVAPTWTLTHYRHSYKHCLT